MSQFRITVVCLGNICRSPIGEAVLRDRIAQAGLDSHVIVDSAGTGDWNLGNPVDRRAAAAMAQHGYSLDHRARQIDEQWFADIDLALAMDTDNFTDLHAMLGQARTRTNIRMFRSFDPALTGIAAPDRALDVPDPYYGGDESFIEVLHMIEAAAEGLVAQLLAHEIGS
ncbi:MAG: low molecular weight protein-tyrosine-phosphatase [Candidatus Nanopelagicales bacterium]